MPQKKPAPQGQSVTSSGIQRVPQNDHYIQALQNKVNVLEQPPPGAPVFNEIAMLLDMLLGSRQGDPAGQQAGLEGFKRKLAAEQKPHFKEDITVTANPVQKRSR